MLAPNGTYQIPAHWQVALGNSAGVGGIIGLIVSCLYFYSKLTLQLNGFIAERIGYKKTMIGGLVYMLGVIFLFFFAKNLEMLLAAEILCGIPWGIFQTLTTSYASEVVPVALRGYLTTWVNACWGIGQLISLAMLRGLLQRDDDWGWRIPYALQWFWPIPLLVIAFLAPESPWWLTRKGRLEDARRSLERLTSPNQHADLDAVVAMMHHTVQLERETTAGATYLDCFRGVNLRRTELTCMSWLVQSYCGSAFMGYSTYFLQQAGLSTSTSFTFSMVQYAINTFGVFIAWFIMAAGVGRRSLYLYGCVWMFCVLIIIGGVSTIHSNGASWAVGIMLLIWSVAYQFTVGTVCYSLVTEFASRHLAIKTISLGRGMYCVAGIVNGSFVSGHFLTGTRLTTRCRTCSTPRPGTGVARLRELQLRLCTSSLADDQLLLGWLLPHLHRVDLLPPSRAPGIHLCGD